ncbi:IBR domain containing protein [Actinidia rufa]|uniref:IBR domain containing protein n=1 Tax=Actinidia rufa TaxID=165716 RepID=A0A7J0EU79_9ERIC|nr:IBR domain containing protein [Actinidia rufa]
MEKIPGRVRNTKGATMADAWIDDVVFEADGDGNLSSWEIIDQSDDEDFSFDEDGDLYLLVSLSSDLSDRSSPHDLIDQITDHDIDVRDVEDVSIDEHCGYDDYNVDYDVVDDDDEEENGDEAYEEDVDDELVPRSVSDRFGGQRLRKLGKRACPKMNNPRKLPCYYYNRPGGVHGKRALGSK